MTRHERPESEANQARNSAVYLGGALIPFGFAILTLGRASEWFDYAFGVVLLGLAVTLAYEGIVRLRRIS